jgi:hypothetical protein
MCAALLEPELLGFSADLKEQFDDQRAIVPLLRFKLVDLIERARGRLVVDSAQYAVVKHAPVPAAKEDRSLSGRRKLAPKWRQPMTFGGFATLVADAVHRIVTGVECGGELLQRIFFAGAFDPFEKDDRPSAVDELRELQFRDVLAQGCKSQILVSNGRIAIRVG